MIESLGIVIVASAVGSSACKVVSCASAVAPSNIIPPDPTFKPLFVPLVSVNALIVGLVKVLFVKVCVAVSCTTSDIANVTVLLVALLAIFEPPEKVNVSLFKSILVLCHYLVRYLNPVLLQYFQQTL